MNNYETVFIVTPVLSDQQVQEVADKFQGVITENGGQIVNKESWGLKKLAYPIQKKTTGFYFLVEFTGEGSIVNVKPGYANNYLIPQGYAKAATASAKKVLAENLRQRAHKDAKILADAQALAETIANLPLSLSVKAEEGKLFGTVTATDLAEALAAKGINVDRKQISVEAVKTVGEFEATARLHKEVKATIKFSVSAAE